jgi:pseudouridine-5'-phosphate glycosidase
VRDIPFVLASGASGATTVSSTMRVAHGVGIDVFSTGGIGGVHRGWETTSDVSQDLHELSRNPVLVVSAGAKAILDIPKTVERLESLSVPVVGYKTNDFPAFYSRKSGIKIDHKFDDIKLLANGFVKHRSLGFSSGMLVVNPPPKENEISNKVVSGYIENALRRAKELGVSGKNLTPFLLHEVYKESNGESLKTNIALALSNIKLGAEIAVELKNV